MKWLMILEVSVIVVLMIMYDWPKMNPHMKKEKITFLAITMIGGILAILLIIYPELPGPTQLVDMIYKPLGKLLEP